MKNSTNKLLIVIILILSLLLLGAGGYIIYGQITNNSMIKNDENDITDNSQNANNVSEEDKEEDKNIFDSVNNKLSAKYTNVSDINNYIIFNTDGTWEGNKNKCELYYKVSGTYTIENDEIILNILENEVPNKDTLTIQRRSNELIPNILYNEGYNFSSCTNSQYFIIEK